MKEIVSMMNFCVACGEVLSEDERQAYGKFCEHCIITMGKRGPKPGSNQGPRKKDTPLRRYWRLAKRKQVAKQRRKKR